MVCYVNRAINSTLNNRLTEGAHYFGRLCYPRHFSVTDYDEISHTSLMQWAYKPHVRYRYLFYKQLNVGICKNRTKNNISPFFKEFRFFYV